MDKIYHSIAEIIVLQKEIFNCTIEDVWEKHLHPRVAEVHSFEKIKPYVERLMAEKKKQVVPVKRTNKLEVQGFFVEHEGYVVALIETSKGDKLKVFQNGSCIYQYPGYNPSVQKIQLLLRRYLNIRRFPVKSWKYINPKEFEQIINKSSTNNVLITK